MHFKPLLMFLWCNYFIIIILIIIPNIIIPDIIIILQCFFLDHPLRFTNS